MNDWRDHVRIARAATGRPQNGIKGSAYLLGDTSKAKAAFGWEPKVRFHELVQIMLDADASTTLRPAQGKAQHRSSVAWGDATGTGVEVFARQI